MRQCYHGAGLSRLCLPQAMGESFLPLFTKIQEPLFGPLLMAGGATSDHFRLNALCVYIDVVEWCGAAGLAYVPKLLPSLASCIQSELASLRQCAYYGVGIVAQVRADAGNGWG